MLLAVIQNTSTSIVIVPFVILMDNLIIRAIDIGVNCIQYRLLINSG